MPSGTAPCDGSRPQIYGIARWQASFMVRLAEIRVLVIVLEKVRSADIEWGVNGRATSGPRLRHRV